MNENNNPSIPETLTWKAHAFKDHDRSPNWYIGLILVSIGLIAFAIYNKSIMTTITFGLIIFIVFVLSLQKPHDVEYKITKTGISSGKNIYPYKAIKTFWVLYNPPAIKTVNFETTAFMNNKISLQLGNQDPVLVKKVLSQYLPEDLDREESATEVLARRLKI